MIAITPTYRRFFQFWLSTWFVVIASGACVMAMWPPVVETARVRGGRYEPPVVGGIAIWLVNGVGGAGEFGIKESLQSSGSLALMNKTSAPTKPLAARMKH